VELWFCAKQHLLKTLAFFLAGVNRIRPSSLLGEGGLERFPTCFLARSKPILADYLVFNRNEITRAKSYKGFLKVGHSLFDIVRLAIYYLTLSICEDGCINSRLLEKSLSMISSIYPVAFERAGSDLRESWRGVRNAILSAYDSSRQ